MSAESTLYAALSGWAGLTSLVSTRIYPDEVPLSVALPAVAWLRESTEFNPTIHGTITPGSTKALMDIACVAETRPSAEAVADQVVAACMAGAHYVTDRSMQRDPDTNLYAVTLRVDVWE